jgi:hypothetical protein
MYAHLRRQGLQPPVAARQAGAPLRRLAAVLAAACCGLLAWAAAVPAAFATPTPQPYLPGEYGTGPVAPVPAATRVIIAGGMAGWQITLIAVAAAVVAATVAVVLDRARVARRAASVTTA